MPADPHLHEFTMLQRAIRAMAEKGMFDEAGRLLEKLYAIAPEDPNYSRTKWRFAVELVKTAVVQQKRGAASAIAESVERTVDPTHITSAERELMDRARGDLMGL